MVIIHHVYFDHAQEFQVAWQDAIIIHLEAHIQIHVNPSGSCKSGGLNFTLYSSVNNVGDQWVHISSFIGLEIYPLTKKKYSGKIS